MKKKAASANRYIDARKVFRFGGIASVGADSDEKLVCRILDPLPSNYQLAPRTIKLLNRLKFYIDWISIVAPRTNLAIAARSRLHAIFAIENAWELNGIPLLKGLDTPEQTVHIAALIQGYSEKNIWSERRSSVADERVGGTVFTAGDNAIFFLGMRDQIITSLEAQDFDNIATKSFDQEVKHCTVLCKISPYRWKFFKRLIDDRILDRIQIKHKKSHLEFEATGYLYFSSSGIVHGFILPDDE